MIPIQLCIHCKHCQQNADQHFCCRDVKDIFSMVDGTPIPEKVKLGYDCRRQRYGGECGTDAKFYEPYLGKGDPTDPS